MAIENFELFDEIMLKVMQTYEYDYEEIAKDLFRGEIVFYDYYEEDTSSKIQNRMVMMYMMENYLHIKQLNMKKEF